MSKVPRIAIVFTLILAIVAGGLLSAGCGKKQAALQQPTIELYQYLKGSTADFDDATINQAADAGGEAGFKFGIAKTIYPTVWATNEEAVANQLFPPPYFRGDGVTTKYDMLSSGDQQTVDGTIFATKLSQAEQDVVTNAILGFFNLYDQEIAAAKALEQNTAYGILAYQVSAAAAAAWKTDATAWMTALNAYAAANYGGKTYAQLTYIERKTVEGIVFANGAGTINPEYAFWRAMVKTSFRNGNASARWPDKRDALTASMYPGKSYSQLDCVQKPTVDGAVWASCNTTEQKAVTNPGDPANPGQIEGLWNLATEQVNGVTSDNMNVYVYALSQVPDAYLVSGNVTVAIGNWLTAVNGTAAGTSENTSFYAELLYGQAQWKGALAYQYFGTDNYSALSTESRAVVDQADSGMMSLSVAQRSAAMALTSNVLYQTLYGSVSSTAAEGWKKDVGAGGDYDVGTGINRELAFYKWLAYESFRAGTAATFYPTQVAAKVTALYPGKTYATLTSCEQLAVNAAVWAALGTGEQDYVQGSTGALVGMWNLVQAEMTDAVAMDQTYLSMTLRNAAGDETVVINWKKDVDGGMLVKAAFYRWLAKEALLGLKGLGTLIRLGTAEFQFKVTNPNKYEISIDSAQFTWQVNSTAVSATGDKVYAAKVVTPDKVWVPAKSELLLKVVAPIKELDMITWAVMSGETSTAATQLANDVWSQYQAGTQTWIITIGVKASSEKETQDYTYNL